MPGITLGNIADALIKADLVTLIQDISEEAVTIVRVIFFILTINLVLFVQGTTVSTKFPLAKTT